MSGGERLREAATAIRRDYDGGGDDAAFEMAVADWLDEAAQAHLGGDNYTGPARALAVADAYLGGAS